MQSRIDVLGASIGLRPFYRFLYRFKLRNQQVSLLRVLVIFLQKLDNDDLLERAYGVAFNLTLSVFPSVIFIFTLLPYLPFIDNEQTMGFLQEVMPPSIYRTAEYTILDILSRPRGGLLSFGAVFALYLATSGMISLMHAFNRIHLTREDRSYLKTRAIATGLTITLAVVLLLAVLLLIAGQWAIDWIYHQNALLEDAVFYLLIFLRFLIMFLSFLLTCSSIYYLAPNVHDRWHFLSPGAVLSALLCLAVSFIFSAYITNFGTYNKFYGSIGALIALMVWLYMLAVILLAGFTLNASIDLAVEQTRHPETVQAAAIQVRRLSLGQPNDPYQEQH